jgi:hypothetical protein
VSQVLFSPFLIVDVDTQTEPPDIFP